MSLIILLAKAFWKPLFYHHLPPFFTNSSILWHVHLLPLPLPGTFPTILDFLVRAKISMQAGNRPTCRNPGRRGGKRGLQKGRAQTQGYTYMYVQAVFRTWSTVYTRSTLQSHISAEVHAYAIRLGLDLVDFLSFLFFCLCLVWSYAADYHHTTNLTAVLGVWLSHSLSAATSFSASPLSFAFDPSASQLVTTPTTQVVELQNVHFGHRSFFYFL
ncbi:hypothetical protein F5Y05DRAFT_63685 [Hypoxylon sp. FL0543]|nr:hypothetical protein F5Y05DRAFT_63685 [Hypoxylon sp. FL0543]